MRRAMVWVAVSTLSLSGGTASAATITLGISITDTPPRNFIRTIDTVTVVPSTVVTQITGITGQLTDIAYAPSGALYAINPSNLYLIDPATGVATDIGRTLQFTDAMNALAFDAFGTLYAASGTSSNLFTLDLATGAATVAGSLPPGHMSSGDLAFDDAGVLWATTTTLGGFGFDSLSRLEPGGVGTEIGSLDRRLVYGLAFADDTLFGLGGAIYQIDRNTGALISEIGSFSNVQGADFLPIPEPGTASLILAGLALLGAQRHGRRIRS